MDYILEFEVPQAEIKSCELPRDILGVTQYD